MNEESRDHQLNVGTYSLQNGIAIGKGAIAEENGIAIGDGAYAKSGQLVISGNVVINRPCNISQPGTYCTK